MAESVKSAERVLRIIELLTRAGAKDFPDVCAELELPKSSAHALLATMRKSGFLDFDETTRVYRLGPRLWEAGQAYLRDLDIVSMAMPALKRVCAELDETVQLAVLDGTENVYVAKVESSHPLQLVSKVGSRLPAYTTGLGKALLAGLPDAEIRRRFASAELTAFTRRTITNVPDLLAELARIRKRGYATDSGEYSEGVFCVAAAVTGHSGPIAAMSVSIPEVRVSPTVKRQAITVITGAVASLSDQFGS